MKVKLSMAFQDLRGKDGTVVISKNRIGLVARPRTTPKNPKSSAQQGVRNNLSKAAAAFKNMTTAQAAAWNAYAQTIVKHNPITGQAYIPSAISVFVGLASKYLQVNPSGAIPMTPPASAFAGDTITFTVTVNPTSLVFNASGTSATNVKTEILLQPLKSRNRVPSSKGYRTKGFWSFAISPFVATVPVTAGYYAAAYRFVSTQTGQTTALQPLGVYAVGVTMLEEEDLPLAA